MATETVYICDWCRTRAPADDEGYAPKAWKDDHALGQGCLLCAACIGALEDAGAKVRAEREKIAWATKTDP